MVKLNVSSVYCDVKKKKTVQQYDNIKYVSLYKQTDVAIHKQITLMSQFFLVNQKHTV